MGFIKNLKKLGEEENKVFLFLVVWLLMAYACMIIFTLLGMAIVGIMIYYPLLAFTLFLWFISLFKKRIREFSMKKFILLLAIDILLMFILLFAIVVILIVAVLSYIFLTSYFIVVGCYKAGKDRDEKLYYKKGAWFWRRLEFHGGLIFSLILLFVFLFATLEVASFTDVTGLIVIAYIAVIIVLIVLTIYCYIESFLKKRLNGWLGTYFVFITAYTFYLVLKVFLRLYEGTGEMSPLYQVIALLFLDLFILLYSIGAILGKQGEVLAKKTKIFSIDTIFLWLIFCKAAFEFGSNFPWGTFGLVQAFGFGYPSEIGPLFNLIAVCSILAIFFFLTIVYGFYGIHQYGKEKEHLKAKRKEIMAAKKSGKGEEAEVKSGDVVVADYEGAVEKSEIEEKTMDEENEDSSTVDNEYVNND